MRTTERFPPGLPTPMPTSTSGISTSSSSITTNILVTSLASSSSISPMTEQFSSSASPLPLQSTTTSSSSALSPGTIAGITVGSCLGFLAVASAIAFLLLHRRRKHQGPQRLTEDVGFHHGLPKEFAASPETRCPAELEDKPMELRELPVDTHPQAASPSPTSRPGHISVNAIPVEAAADPVQRTTTEAAEQNN